jgi:hypothetical protein
MTLKWVAGGGGGVEAPLPQPLSKYEPPIESKNNKNFFMTLPQDHIRFAVYDSEAFGRPFP